jgi:phosphofructokinase-like protein
MRIGILNSGGDCPGLNAVIHGAVGAASELGWEVIGFRDGFEGLLPDGPGHMTLDAVKTIGILKLGGTILGTTNKGNFAAKVGVDNVSQIPVEIMDAAKATIKYLGIGGLIVVGGDGSLTTGLQLCREGIPVVGVPKTIDNDLQATSTTFGFDSAVSTVVDALDRLHTTAESHQRVMVVEVMGRHAGWIALWGGIGGGADVVLLPEIPFKMEHVAKHVKHLYATGHRSVLIVVAEGATLEDGSRMTKDQQDNEKRQVKLGGIGEFVAKKVEEMTGRETRDVRLGHLQRGGSPTALDRILGARFGVKAVHLIKDKKFGRMVSYQSYTVGDVAIEEAVNQLRLVQPDSEVVQAARAVGISFGDK